MACLLLAKLSSINSFEEIMFDVSEKERPKSCPVILMMNHEKIDEALFRHAASNDSAVRRKDNTALNVLLHVGFVCIAVEESVDRFVSEE